MSRCSICHTRVDPGDEIAACPECRQEYHRTCWDELGGCATYGCREAVEAEKSEAQPTHGGWGDEKECPACKRTIPSGTLRCSCGATFPHAEPMSRDEYRAWKATRERRSGARMAIGILFILSLFGLPAPVLGPVAGVIAYRNREALAGRDGTFLAMGYATAALGAMYTILALALWAGF